MSLYDLIIRNGTLVAPDGLRQMDLAIADEKIVEIAPDISGSSSEEIDAHGLHVFPGVIDAHVHFNDPGRTSWEGFATGSRALAAGGATAFFDMPLNAHPPTVDAASFRLKLRAAQSSSYVDFAFWGGLVPTNLDQLDELAACGVVGFKAFMSNSGIEDFAAVDDFILYEGMCRAARLKRIVAVHAENDSLTARLAVQARGQGRNDVRAYLNSRPVIAELEAIERAILFAEETGCSLHIVHVSSGRGVLMVAAARLRGIDVSCETCPHYLTFTDEDVEALGAIAKCSPPIRSQEEQNALWLALFSGQIPLVTSDHSPSPPDMKTHPDFFHVWGGISGCQSLFLLLLTEGFHHRHLPLSTIASVTSTFCAQRFHLGPRKAGLRVGSDADLVLVNLSSSFTLQQKDLFYRHQQSPYVGRLFRSSIQRTLVRGHTVFLEGEIISSPTGTLISPAMSE